MSDDPDLEESMDKRNEASIRRLQLKSHHCGSEGSGITIKQDHELKEEMNVYPSHMESNNSFRRISYTPLNHAYVRPCNHQEFWTIPNTFSGVHKVPQSQMSTFENNFYQMNRDYFFPVENRFHYVPLKMFAQGYQHDLQFQEFEYFVVIDFEATCDKEKKPNPQEIIEFPSVIVNSVTGQLEDFFQIYVRPAYHQHLTDFCKELTGIQQIQVDRGVPLNVALGMHDSWLEGNGIKHKRFAVVTWGDWDCRTMLESECRFKRIPKPPYFNRWINLKVPFQDMFGGVRCNLKEAVQLAGLAWEGRPHCGLDDARNTARLLALLMHRGFRFSITNELPFHPADCPFSTHQPFNNHPIDQTPQPQRLKEAPRPMTQFHPFINPISREMCTYCHCGVVSSKSFIRKPGPSQGRCFFGCGNWTASRRAVCNYFAWASP